MAIKFVSPENLSYFKGKQDTFNEGKFALKTEIPANVSQLTNDSGYQTESQVSTLIEQAVASVFVYKGTVATQAELPAADQKVGDVWHVTDTGAEFAWDGAAWQELGTLVTVTWESIQNKPTTFAPEAHTHSKNDITDLAEWAKADTKPTYTAVEVGAATVDHTHAAFAQDVAGFVPAPTADQAGYVLYGNGSWGALPVSDTMEAMTTEEIDALF